MIIQGVISKISPYPVKETIDRMITLFNLFEITVYARINQQAELSKIGVISLPIEYLLFGNPGLYGEIVALNPLISIETPLKIVVWQTEEGEVLISFNDARYISNRFGLAEINTPSFSIYHLFEELTASSNN